MHPWVKTHYEKPKAELYTEPYQHQISNTQLNAYYKESKVEPIPYHSLTLQEDSPSNIE
jgi:hypothetical protein